MPNINSFVQGLSGGGARANQFRVTITVKLVTVFGKNPGRGFPLIHAAVIALDINNGRIN